MRAEATEDRIRELARDITPVRRIPPLRSVAIAALLLWLVVLGAEWLLGGPGLRLRRDDAWSNPAYLAALAGLVLLALGAISAAFATAVPGRGAVVNLGAGLGALGMLLAITGGFFGLVHGVPLPSADDVRDCVVCMSRSLKLGLASTLVVAGFVVHAAMRRPGIAAALALAGGVALGAAAVHATCPNDSPLHQLVAHVLAPVASTAVLTVPLAMVMERWVRRTRS